jgi:DNA primase
MRNIDKIGGSAADYIVRNVNIVEYVSQYVELNKVGYKDEYSGLCPFHSEKTPSFNVSAGKGYYCFGCCAGGNIIQFAAKYHKLSYEAAVKHLLAYGKIDAEFKPRKPGALEHSLDMIRRTGGYKKAEHVFLPEKILDCYGKEAVAEWIDEGIDPLVLDKYQVRYDRPGGKIVFPIRDGEGRPVAIKARTLNPDYKALGLSKYSHYHKFGANDLLFGLWLKEKREAIAAKRRTIVFEGEKSVMKADSWGILNSVSCAGGSINAYQANKLLSLHCDAVIAFDKDKAPEKIAKQKEIMRLKRLINVYIVADGSNLLGEKDSPIDKGPDVWQELYDKKVKL